MLITFFRAIVLYVIVLIVMRLMGKREIGQLQPFELAISIMIADLASIPMTEIGIPIFNGITPILGLLVMHLIIKFTGLHASPFGKGFVGFALAAIILYFTQYFVAGYSISWMAAIIGALIYGVVDYFIPGNQQM